MPSRLHVAAALAAAVLLASMAGRIPGAGAAVVQDTTLSDEVASVVWMVASMDPKIDLSRLRAPDRVAATSAGTGGWKQSSTGKHATPGDASRGPKRKARTAGSNAASGGGSAMPAASAGTNGTAVPHSADVNTNSRGAFGFSGTTGPTTTLLNGIAIPPPSAPQAIKAAIAAANLIRNRPYVWGGGHASFSARGYDCSGAVSYALHGGGFVSQPMTSQQFESWGVPGPGRWLTVYASGNHVYAVIAGMRWDTVGDAKGSGPRWHPANAYPKGFVARHFPGY
ncbi:MAG: hypothetical protein QOJ01_1011 [Solirubrobacterales bacterium]|jgi:cell wall-associated NlpC family hydrolase|nr:hypothetical protein [Solirubrobacterales bacterium]